MVAWIVAQALFACQPTADTNNRNYLPTSTSSQKAKDPTKVYSLMGYELSKKPLPASTFDKRQQNLAEAKMQMENAPDSLALIIWYGRRLGYVGEYLKAIEVYSDALELFPESYELYRHRGHRHITTRQIEQAIKDFEKAAIHSLNSKNKVEPDGIPNAINTPLSNDKFNIWYHYGLALYLNGRYDKAVSAYKKCLSYSDNDDLQVATSYWLYLTYRKLGNAELGKEVLKNAPSNAKLIENQRLYDLIHLFEGKKSVDSLLKKAENKNGQVDPTYAYGIGCWYQHKGDKEKANELFNRALDHPDWDAFGYIASEAEFTAIFPGS